MADRLTPRGGLEAYSRPSVVALYERQAGLHEAERELFDAYLRPGMAILDVGVGAGRTTPHLASLALRYVGVDFSEAMVRACRERFPALDFRTMDATDMSAFPDASFDAVVFSFNGIDAIPASGGRARCLKECARVLKDGGVFLFSTHNARHLVFTPVLAGVSALRAAWRITYALGHTASNVLFRVLRAAFWRGYGHVWDPSTDGGIRIYVATPEHVAQEARCVGLEVARVLPAHHPRATSPVVTPWYYYACVRRT